MSDPYSVLGVSENATEEQIKDAYRSLARKYQEDSLQDGPLADIARQKMEELDRAYDAVVAQRRGQTNSAYNAGQNYGGASYQTYSNSSYSGYSNNSAYGGSQFGDVRAQINAGRIDDAETILDGTPRERRTAEWYFLKGQIQQRRGWFDEAYKNYSTACQLDPGNGEYTAAFNALNNNARGGYRQTHGGSCTACDICSSLLCADCCCECMGGDLIPGC